MPEWIRLWGNILIVISFSGVTLVIMIAIVFGIWEGMRTWADERKEKRLAKWRKRKKDAND